jgi:flagellar biosynthesis/type III secretory pathway protein FliH
MCEALRELMKDEMEAELEKGIAQGMAEGMEKGMAQGITAGMATGSNATFLANVESLARNLNIPIEEACIKLDRTYEEYLKIKNSL